MNKSKAKNYKDNWPIVAICYDFDKTLSPKDMQNFGLIPKLGCDENEFWKQSNKIAKEKGMDKILAYMKLIVDKAIRNDISITEKDFKKLGKSIELFDGVDDWFDRINQIANEIGIHVEHYIISAGIKEIIEGTKIAKYFEAIYASSFIYDVYGAPEWPRQVVNYTTKTQYLFRISKNCIDLTDENSVNEYIEEDERRIPFRNFIYIGDSETDIPAMKIIKKGGGISIGVYNSQTVDISKVSKLLKQNRIDYLIPAVYTQGSRMEKLVSMIIKRIKANEELRELNKQQSEYVRSWDRCEEVIEYIKEFLTEDDMSIEEVKELKKEAMSLLTRTKNSIVKNYSETFSKDEIDKKIEAKKNELNKLFLQRKKEIKKAEIAKSN